jgi:hypothetical protein
MELNLAPTEGINPLDAKEEDPLLLHQEDTPLLQVDIDLHLQAISPADGAHTPPNQQ